MSQLNQQQIHTNGWPYIDLDPIELPNTLPSGDPWPRISIVTPSFNQGRYLEQTILSVLNQHYPNVEHIIIDGGSSDDTLRIIDHYRDRLAFAVSEPDNGQSHAINKGMARATGNILTWLNSDDMLAPGALAAVALAFYTSGAEMIAGVCQLFSDGKLVAQHLTSCEDGPLPLNDLLDLDGGWNAGQFFYQPEVMFKRSLWERAGACVDEQLFYSMDYELWIRFAEAQAQLHVIGRPIVWFRIHEDQKTNDPSKFKAELVQFRDSYLSRTGQSFVPRQLHDGPRTRLRFVVLNDIGFQYGAGLANKRLAESLLWAGHEVVPIKLGEHSSNGNVKNCTNEEVLNSISAHEPDIVIVGNLHAAKTDPSLIAILAERFPTICILHDFWLLTGRCAYTDGCDKLLDGCDHTCPSPHEYPSLEPQKIANAFAAKRLALNTGLPILFANSQWTADFAQYALSRCGPMRPRIEKIQLSFPLETFRPLDKKLCRAELNLPEDRFILLVTSEFSDRRKGTARLFQALRELQLPDLLVLSTSHSEPDAATTRQLDVRKLGFIRDPESLAKVYNAADLMASGALEETFGQIFVEASACGTPVVGYRASGVQEAILDNVSGKLVAGAGPSELAAAIRELYNNPGLLDAMGRWGRLYVENEWSPFSAYRHFFLALWRLGLASQMAMPRNIRFLPTLPRILNPEPAQPILAPIRGLCDAEGPLPEHDLPTFRWAVGPRTRIEISTDDAGLHLLAVNYRSVHEHQVLTLEINGRTQGEFPLTCTGFKRGRWILWDADLERGTNFIDLHFSKWYGQDENHRPLAIIITKVVSISHPTALTSP
jgi:glycosyltransferase involved in cell wall biosynthesis